MEEFRQAIDALDLQILELIAKRMDFVRQIHAAKRATGLPLFDSAREKEVFALARDAATHLGLEPWLAERLMELIVQASRALQKTPTPHPQQILVVGAQGRMGQLFVEVFQKLGHTLFSVDRGDPLSDELIHQMDVVLLAVPLGDLLPMARQLLPALRPDALLCDLGSLKAPICRLYEESAGCEAVGLHPLFGPSLELDGQKIAFCAVRSGSRTQLLREDLGRLGLEVIDLAPEEHDRLMSVVQILPHFLLLVFGAVLSRLEIAQVLSASTPVLRVLLHGLQRIVQQSPALIAQIQRDNPYGEAMRERVIAAASDLASADPAHLESLLLALRDLV